VSEKRPWLAALLAFVHPGLGHVYLREWTRALLWFALVLTSASLLIPETAAPQAFSLESLRTMSEAMPTETVVVIVGITLLSMVDAYWIATRQNRSQQLEEDGATCPNCGKEIDADIDFCHWCTTELQNASEDSEEPSRV
jgi:hypothetical protein